MWITAVTYFCRISSILLMYLGLLIGGFCTMFIVREFSRQSSLRTSLNLLIVTIFCTDCLRALICAPLESFVLIRTWHLACHNQIDSNSFILNLCRFTTAVRTCFSVTQPFGFIGIAYERLRTIVQRKGNVNRHEDLLRIRSVIIWLVSTFFLGSVVGIYQGCAFSLSNTCYGQSNDLTRAGIIVRLLLLIFAAVVSGSIYGKIFFIIRKHQRNRIGLAQVRSDSERRQRKDLRSAKHTFVIFLSFFLCRLPLIVAMFVGLIFSDWFSSDGQCFYEELSNFFVQIIFLATISDPLVYIRTHPKLREKFSRMFYCFAVVDDDWRRKWTEDRARMKNAAGADCMFCVKE